MDEQFINRVLELVNQARSESGLTPLTLDNQLNIAAENHSQSMAVNDFFSHQDPTNSSSGGDRIEQVGYNWNTWGENIAVGYSTPEQVVDGWLKSPGHRANILSSNFTEIGIGYEFLQNDTGNVNYNHYWTQVFAKPQPGSNNNPPIDNPPVNNPSPNKPPFPDLNPEPIKTELVWEDQGLSDEAIVSTGSMFSLGGGLKATIDWNIQTDGGNFIAQGGGDFVSYESGRKGGDRGYLNLGFDNDAYDPDDLIRVSLRFSEAVTGLNFTVLDVDSGRFFDDAVEIYTDGVNILDNPNVSYTLGDSVKLDNESYMTGFEGRSSVMNSSADGNIQVELGSTSVSEITIEYFSTDDGTFDPNPESIGIGDLTWNA